MRHFSRLKTCHTHQTFSKFTKFRRYSTNHNENSKSFQKIIKDGSDKTIQIMNKNQLVGDMRALFKEMERRKYNMRWIALGGVGVVSYLSYELVKDWFTNEAVDVTNDVTQKYLKNPEFKKNITIFVEDTISELSKSEKVKQDVAFLLEGAVIELASRESVKNELAELFKYVFATEVIRNSGAELSSVVVDRLLTSDEFDSTRTMVTEYFTDEIMNLLADPTVQNKAGTASWNAFKVWFGGGPNVIHPDLIPQNSIEVSKSEIDLELYE